MIKTSNQIFSQKASKFQYKLSHFVLEKFILVNITLMAILALLIVK